MSRRRTASTNDDGGNNNLLIGLAVAAIVILAGGLGYLVYNATRPPEVIDGLIRYPEAVGNQHINGDFYEFEALPQAGGPHNPIWQNCGIYDEVVRPENAVHSLEHGAAWVTYQPDLDDAEVERLRDIVSGRSFTLMSPYPNQESPIVLTTWAYQLEIEDAGDDRIELFLNRYTVDPLTTPELGATCAGGNGTPLFQ